MRVEATRRGSALLVGDRRERERVLVRDRILPDHFEHFEGERAVAANHALKAHEPARRPDLVGAGRAALPCTPSDYEIDLRADLWIREQRVNGAIARLFLLGIEPLPREPLRSVNAHGREP